MQRKYLGDSYDAVKRLWRDLLLNTAPLHADGRFIEANLRDDFTNLTGIPILADPYPKCYSILNDPDTGIRLPGEQNQAEGRTHIAITSILKQLQASAVLCVITFDQSYYRHSPLDQFQQRRAKMQNVEQGGSKAFFYVSHAPFLFAFRDSASLNQVRQILTNAGMPLARLEFV